MKDTHPFFNLLDHQQDATFFYLFSHLNLQMGFKTFPMGEKLKEGQPSLTLVAHKGVDSKQKLANFDKLLASILHVMESSKN
jgi:hypothetical protein